MIARFCGAFLSLVLLALCSACGDAGSAGQPGVVQAATFGAAKPTAAATSPGAVTDPLTILTFKDMPAPCVPMKAVDNDPKDLQKYGGSCCASPGRRACQSSTTAPQPATLPKCFDFDATLARDPYGTNVLCSLPPTKPDPAIPGLGKDGGDLTFYVTSDLHFFRRTFELTDQLKHVQVVKGFADTKAVWPAGVGGLTGTTIAKPIAVIVDGDMTTYGAADNLGAYRMSWERGTLPDSIQYPVLFGLGNHEVVSDETPDNAHRMFDYLQARMANLRIDPGSGNYSWDWNGVHMIQLNTWAGDKTSLYVHPSDGLAWLDNDLKTYVGNTTRPVVMFQHYLFKAIESKTLSTSDDDYWPTNKNAIDSTGKKTGQGYESWYDIVKNYNVIGLFGGHDHCLGVNTSLYSKLPVTGGTYPGVAGYGTPIDNFDDGSGGDTRGTVAQDPKQESAGIGNPCAATVVGGKTIPQTAVASFLVTHVTDRYLDVAAVSWNDKKPAPYFDDAEGMPTGLSACRKRINSQFIPAPSSIRVQPNGNGYTVTSTTGTPPAVPVALQYGSQAGASGYAFVDNCGDAQNDGANHVYYLVNGESSLTPGLVYGVRPTVAAGGPAPVAVLLTPLSGVSTPSLGRSYSQVRSGATVNPVFDLFTVYGPPNQSFQQTTTYSGPASGWLTVTPRSNTFDAYGTVTFVVRYNLGALRNPLGVLASSAQVQVTTGGTGVVQNVKVALRR